MADALDYADHPHMANGLALMIMALMIDLTRLIAPLCKRRMRREAHFGDIQARGARKTCMHPYSHQDTHAPILTPRHACTHTHAMVVMM